MAENKKEIEYALKVIFNPAYRINDTYKLTYLTPESYIIVSRSLSVLRKHKALTEIEHDIASFTFKHNYLNFYKIRDLNNAQPRLIAQKFIGKKKIRFFILNRDGNKCLKCFRTDKLQLDHIIPISKEGKNELSNLQTLCNSCNSIKRDSYADYRSGARQINYRKHGKGITLF